MDESGWIECRLPWLVSGRLTMRAGGTATRIMGCLQIPQIEVVKVEINLIATEG